MAVARPFVVTVGDTVVCASTALLNVGSEEIGRVLSRGSMSTCAIKGIVEGEQVVDCRSTLKRAVVALEKGMMTVCKWKRTPQGRLRALRFFFGVVVGSVTGGRMGIGPERTHHAADQKSETLPHRKT